MDREPSRRFLFVEEESLDREPSRIFCRSKRNRWTVSPAEAFCFVEEESSTLACPNRGREACLVGPLKWYTLTPIGVQRCASMGSCQHESSNTGHH
jgi:hypothetical protein